MKSLIKGGTIVTMDPSRPRGGEVLVEEGRISAVGEEGELSIRPGPDVEVWDLRGRTLYPGFVDSHGHLLALGLAKRRLDLTACGGAEEAARLVGEKALLSREGEWIIGRGWDNNRWEADRLPDHEPLTRAAPRNPVALTRNDGHVLWVNRAALELCGIDEDGADPPGGKIVRRRETGEPTGILLENAMELVTKRIAMPGVDERILLVEEALAECAAHGLTAVHDLDTGRETIEAHSLLAERGRLKLRIYAVVSTSDKGYVAERIEAGAERDLYGRFLSVAALKLYADGALGPGSAALEEDYSDEPGNRGMTTIERADLVDAVAGGARRGFQPVIHAIGDRANRLALDAIEEVRGGPFPAISSLRPRIEHAQVLNRADIDRFARLGVIASVQPVHAVSDMEWAGKKLGSERIRLAYLRKTLLDAGAVVASGSDFPIESLDPIAGIFALVAGRRLDGHPPGGWFRKERLAPEEALRTYTVNAAYASFREGYCGRIGEGMRADFTILSRDITSIEVDEIRSVTVEGTIVDGEIVHRSSSLPF